MAAKAVTNALIGLAVVVSSWVITGSFNQPELVAGILTVVSAAGVYLTRNKVGSWVEEHAKALVPLLVGGAVTVFSWVNTGTFNGQELQDLLLTILAAAGVYTVPNAAASVVLGGHRQPDTRA